MVSTYAPKSHKETIFTTILCILFAINGYYAFVWTRQYLHYRSAVHRTTTSGQLRNYTWIGSDFPTWWEVDWSPVEMEFGETVNYPLDGELGEKQWNSMRGRNYQGYIRIGPEHRLMAVDMFHQLHCVNTFRKSLIRPNDVDATEHHILHCLDYLRQLFLCAADTTLEPYDFLSVEEYTLQGPSRFSRQCRDWSVLYKGMDDYAAEWAEYAEWYNAQLEAGPGSPI